jgi:autotransporter-associated beta strand protein
VNFGYGARTLSLTGTSTGANTIAGNLQDGATVDGKAGTLGLTKDGAGTWKLTGTNTYTGGTTISAGTLQLGINHAIASGKAVTVSGTGASTTATLDLNGFALTVGTAGTSGLTLGGTTTTSAAQVIGAGAGSVLTLAGTTSAVTYSATNNPLGAIISATTLDLNGAEQTVTIGNSTSAANNLTISSAIQNGSLIKAGAGTLVISGANTYSGNTTVTDGTLILADNAGLRFVVGDASNNKITGTGSVTLDGDFTIDTSAVTVSSGSWTLVDAASKSFTDTFTVAGTGWSETSNVWTKVYGSKIWTFTEASGVLELTGGTGTPAQIVVKQDLTTLANNGLPVAYGPVAMGTSADLVFTIENSGTSALNLTGPSPYVVVGGTNSGDFAVIAPPPTTPVLDGAPTTFTVRFTPGLVNSSRSATLTIASDSASDGTFVINVGGSGAPDYNQWKLAYSGDMTSSGDPDGDGLSNFQEYAFGLNPNSGTSANPIKVPLDKATGTFSYTRRDPLLTGITYKVFTSTSLLALSWLEDTGAVQTPGTLGGDHSQTVAVTLSSALLTAPSLFIRVEATQP